MSTQGADIMLAAARDALEKESEDALTPFQRAVKPMLGSLLEMYSDSADEHAELPFPANTGEVASLLAELLLAAARFDPTGLRQSVLPIRLREIGRRLADCLPALDMRYNEEMQNLSASRETLERLGNQLDEAKAQVGDLPREVDRLRKELADRDQEVQSLKRECEEFSQRLDSAKGEVREQEKRRGEFEHELAGCASRLDAVNAWLPEAMRRIDEDSRQAVLLEERRERLQTEAQTAKERRDRIQQEVEHLEQSRSGHLEECRQLEQQHDSARELLARIEELRKTVSDLERDRDGHHAEIDALNSQSAALVQEQETLEAEKTNLNQQVASRRAGVENLRIIVNSLTTELADSPSASHHEIVRRCLQELPRDLFDANLDNHGRRER